MKVFISEPGKGWREVAIPRNFRRYSHDALVSVLHQFIDTSTCKGILITENPEPEIIRNTGIQKVACLKVKKQLRPAI